MNMQMQPKRPPAGPSLESHVRIRLERDGNSVFGAEFARTLKLLERRQLEDRT
jgi:hypothetical protein